MNQRPLIRKIIYLLIIAVLIVPLSMLSMPSRSATQNEPAEKGGKLAQLRDQYKLGQANLGQIDPTSEALKLATLGMRGFAVNIMWWKANEYKKKEDWTGLSAALQQITKLEPNFVSVWQFQGWNLSYNISYEFDDYHDRYFWVMKGVRFMQEGMKYNETAPKLVWNVGWVLAMKIGIADEKVQFRRLFREDNDFNGARPLAERDNWLVGRQYYLEAEQVAIREQILDTLNPLVFMFHAPKALINYAQALEDDGIFEERARIAWQEARASWLNFGNRDISTTDNRAMRLNDLDRVTEEISQLTAQLDALPPTGRREAIYQEKLAKLTPEERAAVEKPIEQRTQEQHNLFFSVQPGLEPIFLEQAERVDAEHRDEAKKLARQIDDLTMTRRDIDRGREVINYQYWLTRCELECRPEAIDARRLIYEADKAFTDVASIAETQRKYEEGFALWDKVLNDFPTIRKDALFGDDMGPFINRYIRLLKIADQPFPDKFPLQDILDAWRAKQN